MYCTCILKLSKPGQLSSEWTVCSLFSRAAEAWIARPWCRRTRIAQETLMLPGVNPLYSITKYLYCTFFFISIAHSVRGFPIFNLFMVLWRSNIDSFITESSVFNVTCIQSACCCLNRLYYWQPCFCWLPYLWWIPYCFWHPYCCCSLCYYFVPIPYCWRPCCSFPISRLLLASLFLNVSLIACVPNVGSILPVFKTVKGPYIYPYKIICHLFTGC